MPLTPTHIVRLSDLLNAALTLDPAERETWLAALPEEEQTYATRLREMLAQHDRMDEHPLLETLPRLSVPVAELAHEGDVVGPYRLLRPLGRGGMSVVWLAERADEGVQRQVAVKLPLMTLSSPGQLERFARERDVLAALEHPHIARLYEAGVSPAGQPYLVLEAVDGLPLIQHCDEQRLKVAERLRLFLQVLAAVEHAHGHLVIHRDLKPSNILVDKQGQVKLLDFGIAKLLPDPSTARSRAQSTQQGGWALTPLYAAPEQLQGQAIATTADVYALGVVLYELLTGEWPYEAGRVKRSDSRSIAELMHAVINTEPTRPSAAALQEETSQQRSGSNVKNLRAALRGDLDTIVMKALRKLPGQRYRSAERFADDVQRFLDHQPIAARPPSWIYSARLFARRHRGASLASSVGMVVALAFGVLAWQQHKQSVEYQQRAGATRDFMVDLVSNIEPDENHTDAPITARQLLGGAADKVHHQYRDKPRLQGDMLVELGRLHHELGELDLARSQLSEALDLLEAHAPDTDTALNKSRALLARVLVMHGPASQQTYALRLADASLKLCRSSDNECARVRSEAFGALAGLARMRGRYGEAVEMFRRQLDEATLGYGVEHHLTLRAMHSLAINLRNAGQLLEASATSAKLAALTRNSPVRPGMLVQSLELHATLDLDLGRYESAHRQILDLIKRVYGPDSTPVHRRSRSLDYIELAVLQRSLAQVHLALGDPVAAEQAASTAFAMFGPGEFPDQAAYARQTLIQAHSFRERPENSLNDMQLVVDELLGMGQSRDAVPVLRARRLNSELLARAGRLSEARQELEAIALTQTVQTHPVRWAETLDLLGSVLRELGLPTQALAQHERALVLFQKVLPIEHPFLARNALYREAARMEANGGAGRDRVLQQAELYKRLFPAESIWRKIIERYLDNSCVEHGAQSESQSRCLLIL